MYDFDVDEDEGGLAVKRIENICLEIAFERSVGFRSRRPALRLPFWLEYLRYREILNWIDFCSGSFDDPHASGETAAASGRRRPCHLRKVAERPARRTGSRLLAANRQIRLRRWAPRSVPMNECSSSMTMNASDCEDLGRRCAWFTNSDSIDSGVISSTPEGCSSKRRFGDADTSPCHLWTGISASWQSSSSRENWSLINALSGPT